MARSACHAPDPRLEIESRAGLYRSESDLHSHGFQRAASARSAIAAALPVPLNEIAVQSGARILLEEAQLPVRDEVKGACELLGLDPLLVANEGKLLAIVAAEAILKATREHPLRRGAVALELQWCTTEEGWNGEEPDIAF